MIVCDQEAVVRKELESPASVQEWSDALDETLDPAVASLPAGGLVV